MQPTIRSARFLPALLAIAIPAVVQADVTFTSAGDKDLPLATPGATTSLFVDPAAAPVVHEAAGLLAGDVGRVAGTPLALSKDASGIGATAVLVGTLGDGGPVDQLASAGKVDVAAIRGKWETFVWQVVNDPMPGVKRALVILGSDRRGTAYGCTELCKAIGVSPWNWWADVPVPHHDRLTVTADRHVDGPPGVKYRGIFFNDEDFGLRPWAAKTFDSGEGDIGPKSYAKVYELMLRLRLNYLWPAMHGGANATEFGTVAGNPEMADHWAVVMGASHCEPMLRNNVFWKKSDGPWRYDQNRDNILKYWTESVDQRGNFEAVWTLGIRGIHDSQMQGPPDKADRVKMVEGIMADQRKLIDGKVTPKYGPPAECLVPYKEVLPLYDAGMKVPDDVTLVWPDDNFGYIRHLPTPAERQRAGGNGVYYHVSYWGSPHSYLWLESNPLGLMWEELHKAWQNDAGRLWVLNVGDLKPGEMATDFYAQLAWSPDSWGPDAQDKFMRRFLTENFGAEAAGPIFDMQSAYFRVATRRKPEHLSGYGRDSKGKVKWIDSLSEPMLNEVARAYEDVLALEAKAAEAVPADRKDSYFEMFGYPARSLGHVGQLYAALSRADRGLDADANRERAQVAMKAIHADTDRYNNEIAGGKWHYMMGLEPNGVTWPKEVGGKDSDRPQPESRPKPGPRAVVLDGAAFTSTNPVGTSNWKPVAGLGRSGHAVTVLPATPFNGDGPSATYTFELTEAAEHAGIRLEFLPTMRVDPAGHLRVSISIDGAPAVVHEVPGGDSSDENSGPRREGVLANRVQLSLPAVALPAGPHTLKVTAIDAGVVLDQIELPSTAKIAH